MNAKTCHDCIHSMGNADNVLWCYEPSMACAVPESAAAGCEHYEREPGADADQRDPHRVFYAGDDWARDRCTICGRAGHSAASCQRPPIGVASW